MQGNIKAAARTIGMYAFAFFISFFVYISLFVIVRELATDVVGYTVYEVNSEGKAVDIETVSTPPKTLEDNMGYREVRSDITAGATATLGFLQVVCGVGIVFCMVGSVLAKEAAKDRNDVDFNRAKQDKLRGLKIGLFAAVPALVLNISIIVLKLMGLTASAFYWVYRWMIMCPVKPIVDLLTGNAANLSEVPVWSTFVLLGFTVLFVAFCAVMYIICYNEDSVIAKLLYKSAKKKKDNVRRLG